MELQYDKNIKYKEYSVKQYSIGQTFSVKKQIFLPYVRTYEGLTQEQLLNIIRLAKDNNWTALDLTDCGLKSLPDELWEVTSLKLLYIGNMSIEGSKNKINEISENIEKLINLEALSIANLPSPHIPRAIRKMPKLTYLDCFGCYFDKISDNLLNPRIKSIGIECKNLDQFQQLCKIRKIEEIYLTGSNVTAIPGEIGNLSFLKKLVISRSRITSIPDTMMNLKRIELFIFAKTPLEKSIPSEIREQTAIEIINYICKQQKEKNDYFFNESKMIVVGQGNVGKSCLVERITENKYEDKESTEGIDIKKWEYIIKKKRYNLNIWDFGGQEIYHSTHQFFLTKRSLYILVWDARAEEEYGRIDYWLRTIQSFADDSPIIIAINKCDENVTRINRIDLKEYRERYPQIRCVLDISCKDNINIQRLRDLIKKEASNLPITKERWLKSWYDIRQTLLQKSKEKKYISLEQYLDICAQNNVSRNEALSLSKYLHDLGIILHYQSDKFLKNVVILYPEWSTNALYKILDSQETILRGRNGILYLSDLPKIWSDSEIYPEDKYVFLLRIMEKFDLCYEINDETFLVAELLENTTIDCPKEWTFEDEECICVNYKYDFMPAGLMTRFIVKIHNYIAREKGKNLCWKKGVYLTHKSAYASVVMKDSISEKMIEVKVHKTHNSLDERELLYAIRETIRNLNDTFNNLNVQELVPCNCEPKCTYQFSYNVLCDALEKNINEIQCYKSFKKVNILNLLEGIDMINREEINPYAIKIENNPVITTTISSTNATSQINQISFTEIRRDVMEMQGDIAELQNELDSREENEIFEIKNQLEVIKNDLDAIEKLKSAEEVVKSGKLNKLKRLLANFSDENSNERKIVAGAKNIAVIIGGLLTKYNCLADKIGISRLPF